jgi:hypothetical protein
MSPRAVSVLLAVAVLLLVSCSSPASAQSVFPPTSPEGANDIDILNFALTLENADSTFFSSYLIAYAGQLNTSAYTPPVVFAASDFEAAGFNASVYADLVQLAQEEITHAALLTATVAAIGGTPVPKCEYNFSSVTTVLQYLQLGQAFEAVGTSAYDGGINALSDPNLQTATATIATVEARHSSYLNELLGVQPFPSSGFDPTRTPEQVYSILKPFLVKCTYTVVFPTVRPYGVAFESLTETNFTGPLAAGSGNTYTAADAANDLLVLNYALILEQLESAFYNYSNSLFSATDFANAGYNSSIYNYFEVIELNEAIHVAALRAVISARGGTPNPPCNYSFPLTDLASYLATAQLLENTGVSAYDGAVNGIADTNLQQVAATIATVEARHAAFLNQLNGVSPFPSPMDTALAPATVAAAASAFQVCPFTPILPTLPAALQEPTTGSTSGSAGVSGDPSFVGFHGQQFQVHGIPNRVFNILSLQQLQLNARFSFIGANEVMTGGEMRQARLLAEVQGVQLPLTPAWSHDGTFMSEMGLKLGSQRLHVKSGAYATGLTVTVDGIVAQPGSVVAASDAMRVTVGAHSLQVQHGLISFDIVNSDGFLNIERASLRAASASTQQLDGLLGQTAHRSNTEMLGGSQAVKEHQLLDYLLPDVDALFSDDFVRNRFTSAVAAQ